jgi:hypothetical protein
MANQEGRFRLLPVRAVARNWAFLFGNSAIRFKASFSDAVARGGLSTLSSLTGFRFFMKRAHASLQS